MPRHTASPQSESEGILEYAVMAARMLREIGDATNASYLKTTAGVSGLIFDTVQVSNFHFHFGFCCNFEALLDR